MDLSRYTALLRTAAAEPGPVAAVRSAANLRVEPPAVELSWFSPVGRQGHTAPQPPAHGTSVASGAEWQRGLLLGHCSRTKLLVFKVFVT